MLFSSVQYCPLFFETFVDFAWVVHVYHFVLATAGRVGESAKAKARQRASSDNPLPAIFGMFWFPLSSCKIFSGVFVPEGPSTIAQRFIAGEGAARTFYVACSLD
jgi:hypothetical protein